MGREQSSRRGIGGAFYTLSKRAHDTARVACTVSKKVAPRAVDRNRAKRVCRAVFAPHLKGTRGLFIVQVRTPALGAPHRELAHEASRLMKEVIGRRN